MLGGAKRAREHGREARCGQRRLLEFRAMFRQRSLRSSSLCLRRSRGHRGAQLNESPENSAVQMRSIAHVWPEVRVLSSRHEATLQLEPSSGLTCRRVSPRIIRVTQRT